MKQIGSAFQLLMTSIGGWIGYVIGGYDGFVYALVAFVVTDYITGVMCSIIDKKLSSEVGFRGIFKKVLIFAMVAIGNIADKTLIGSGEIVRTAVIFFYLSNEGLSLVENASRIGLPIPKKLKDVLHQLNDRGDTDDDK